MTPTTGTDTAHVGRIWKNATWLGAVPILLNIVAIFSTGYITRRVGAAEFGRFSISLAILGLVAIATDFGMRGLAVRDLARVGPGSARKLGAILSLRLALSTLGMVITWGVAAALSSTPELTRVLLVSSLSVVPIGMVGTYSDGLVARDHAKATSGATFWSGVLLTATSVIAVTLSPNAVALAASYVVGPVVNLLLLMRQTRTLYGRIDYRWRPRQWRVLVRRGFPFIKVGALGVATGRIEVPLLAWYFGDQTAGIYAAAVSLADRLAAIVDSICTATLPTLMRIGDDAERVTAMIGRILHPMLGALLAGTIMATLGSTAAVTVVFGREYAPGGVALAVALYTLPLIAINSLVYEGYIAMRRVPFAVSTSLKGQWVAAFLMPVLPRVLGLAGIPAAKLIGLLTVVAVRHESNRQLFTGLWSPLTIRTLVRRCLWAVPVPVILALGDFRPVATVAIAGGGFLVWLAATARSSGVLQLLRDRRG